MERLARFVQETNLATSEPEVFDIAARYTAGILGVERCSIALLDDAGIFLNVVALDGAQGAIPMGRKVPLAGTMIAEVVGSRNVVIVDDARETSYKDLELLKQHGLAFMDAPLISGGAVLGTLNAMRVEAGSFDEGDKRVIEQVAAILASNISGRRLFQRIQRANENMRRVYATIDSAIFTVGLDGVVSPERSAVTDRWLGRPNDGEKVWQWWRRSDPKAADWMELTWDFMDVGTPVEAALAQMPSRMVVGDQTLRCTYLPVEDSGALSHFLVVISDVTADVADSIREERQREFGQMAFLLMQDSVGAEEFMSSTSALMDEIETGTPDVKRLVHTVKGNCEMFGLQSVARIAHELESALIEEAEVDLTPLTERWSVFKRDLATVFERRSADEIYVEREELNTLERMLDGGTSSDEVLVFLRSLGGYSLRARLCRLGHMARGLAERLHKGCIEVDVQSVPYRIESAGWEAFFGSMVHALRNAIDHGLESPEEREALGKGPARIALRADYVDRQLVVEVADDGRGIDWDRVRDKAKSMDLNPEGAKDLVEVLFADGFSTRDEVTMVSGRGLGLGAVREATYALGGEIEVESTHGRGTTLRFRFPHRPGV